MAYELIETIEVGAGGAASIEFTSIPQDGVDLLLIYSLASDYTGLDYSPTNIRLNSDSGSNYAWIALRGSGSGVSSDSNASDTEIYNFTINTFKTTSNVFSNAQLYISNYTSTSDKSISIDGVTENNATSAIAQIQAAKYSTSSGITSILIDPVAGNLVQYSTASLYKIS